MTPPARAPMVYFGTCVETADPVFGWVALPWTDALIQQLRRAFVACVDEHKEEVVFPAHGSVWSHTVTPVVVNPTVVVTNAGQFRVYAFADPGFDCVATTWRDVEHFASNVLSGERCFEEDPVRLKELWRLSERRGVAQ
ncbi:hypothetical protein [Rhodanobacter sp. FW106-PBR-LB-2-11]|uniref:hypothetical protein n=1 Tax=Rhodanobacter sp. FW106-PBR-LB-2-11 TaxID=1524463 RepID=UPI0034E440D0